MVRQTHRDYLMHQQTVFSKPEAALLLQRGGSKGAILQDLSNGLAQAILARGTCVTENIDEFHVGVRLSCYVIPTDKFWELVQLEAIKLERAEIQSRRPLVVPQPPQGNI